jgi:hypothetical protein
MSKPYNIQTIPDRVLRDEFRYQGGAELKYKIPWQRQDATKEPMAIFKVDREPKDRNIVWVEKFGEEIATAMGLPTANYLMCRTEDDRVGILSPSFMQIGARERPAMVIMQKVLNSDERSYTIENAFKVFDRTSIELPSDYNPPPEIKTAKDLLVGYLIHDYYIDNPDRHDRNWGIQIDLVSGRQELLPNYDYGRALTDFPVTSSRMEVFAERLAEGRTCAFINDRGYKIGMDEMVRQLKEISPAATKYWCRKIDNISAVQIGKILDRFPPDLIRSERKEFTQILLPHLGDQLSDLVFGDNSIAAKMEEGSEEDLEVAETKRYRIPAHPH